MSFCAIGVPGFNDLHGAAATTELLRRDVLVQSWLREVLGAEPANTIGDKIHVGTPNTDPDT